MAQLCRVLVCAFLALSLRGAASDDDVVGCGGFVRPDAAIDKVLGVKPDFSGVRVQLLSVGGGVVKSSTECAPNGYYYLPIDASDTGEFRLVVTGPEGWAFDAAERDVKVSEPAEGDEFDDGAEVVVEGCDGDVNFALRGFSLTGAIEVAGCDASTVAGAAAAGAAGVAVLLTRAGGDAGAGVRKAVTDAAGRYVFDGVPPGDYSVRAEHAHWGFATARAAAGVRWGTAEVAAPALALSGYDVRGRVLSGTDGGSGVAGVDVLLCGGGNDAAAAAALSCAPPPGEVTAWLSSKAGERIARECARPLCSAASGADGRYFIAEVPCGPYTVVPVLRASADGEGGAAGAGAAYDFAPASAAVRVVHGGAEAPPFRVTGFTLQGAARDGAGAGIAGVEVLLDGEPRATTGADGTFRIAGMTPSVASLEARKEGLSFGPAVRGALRAGAGQNVFRVRAVRVCGAVRGAGAPPGIKVLPRTLRLREGRAETSAAAGAGEAGGSADVATTTTDAEGAFCFDAPVRDEAASYAISVDVTPAEAQAGLLMAPSRRVVTVTPAAPAPQSAQDFAPARAHVGGTVQCLADAAAGAAPCAGAGLRLALEPAAGGGGGAAGTTTAAAAVGADGSFSFGDVAPGEYEIAVQGEGRRFCWAADGKAAAVRGRGAAHWPWAKAQDGAAPRRVAVHRGDVQGVSFAHSAVALSLRLSIGGAGAGAKVAFDVWRWPAGTALATAEQWRVTEAAAAGADAAAASQPKQLEPLLPPAGGGVSRFCMRDRGTYALTRAAASCVDFGGAALVFDSEAVPAAQGVELAVAAERYRVGGIVRVPPAAGRAAGAVRVRVRRGEGDGAEESVVVADVAGDAEGAEYVFWLWAADGERVVVEVPAVKALAGGGEGSDADAGADGGAPLLFYPRSRSTVVTAAAACTHQLGVFSARGGRVLRGVVRPALPGVAVTVASGGASVATVLTDDNGAFATPPLHDDVEFDVTASKEGHYFQRENDGKGEGEGAQIVFGHRRMGRVRVVVEGDVAGGDGGGEAVGGVLLSLSGGEAYRSNRRTAAADGGCVFDGLMPGSYFLRPQLKELQFEPASHTIEVGGASGGEVLLRFRARRVAFSVFGRVRTLDGSPLRGVALAAMRVRETAACGTDDRKCAEEAAAKAAKAAAAYAPAEGELYNPSMPAGWVVTSSVVDETTTAADGSFRLRGLAPGERFMVIQRAPKKVKGKSAKGRDAALNGRLMPRHVPVKMSARDVRGLQLTFLLAAPLRTVCGRVAVGDELRARSALRVRVCWAGVRACMVLIWFAALPGHLACACFFICLIADLTRIFPIFRPSAHPPAMPAVLRVVASQAELYNADAAPGTQPISSVAIDASGFFELATEIKAPAPSKKAKGKKAKGKKAKGKGKAKGKAKAKGTKSQGKDKGKGKGKGKGKDANAAAGADGDHAAQSRQPAAPRTYRVKLSHNSAALAGYEVQSTDASVAFEDFGDEVCIEDALVFEARRKAGAGHGNDSDPGASQGLMLLFVIACFIAILNRKAVAPRAAQTLAWLQTAVPLLQLDLQRAAGARQQARPGAFGSGGGHMKVRSRRKR
eukprot:g2254.t1